MHLHKIVHPASYDLFNMRGGPVGGLGYHSLEELENVFCLCVFLFSILFWVPHLFNFLPNCWILVIF